jgi:phage-related protein (TIGR01555 family)
MAKKVIKNVRKNAPKKVDNADSLLGGIGANIFGTNGVQLSQTDTLWKNLRFYLVSNMRNLLSQMYVEHGLVQTLCRVPVEDALRGGVSIKTSQLSEEEIKKLETFMNYQEDFQHLKDAGTWQRLYGGGAILVVCGQDPETPLDAEALFNLEDDELEFKGVDMWELFHALQNIEGDGEPLEYSRIEFYNYYGKRVHHSRVFRMKGLEAPSFIRPRLRGWGMSCVEPMVRSINQYLKSNNLTFEVLDEFKLDVFKLKNLANTLFMPKGKEKVLDRVQAANGKKNYLNSIVLDSEDDYQQKQISFSGLAETQAQIRMQVASDLRMPMTKLFGISAAGFNSGEDDIEVYNSMVESEVRSRMEHPILKMIELRCAQKYGFIPDDISIEFKPLRILSAEQEENVKTQKFNRLFQARQANLISQDEFNEGCNKDNLLPVHVESDFVDMRDVSEIEGGEISEKKKLDYKEKK